jgi:hypothetical protein
MREDFIKNAINFLKNPKLTETPMSQKVLVNEGIPSVCFSPPSWIKYFFYHQIRFRSWKAKEELQKKLLKVSSSISFPRQIFVCPLSCPCPSAIKRVEKGDDSASSDKGSTTAATPTAAAPPQTPAVSTTPVIFLLLLLFFLFSSLSSLSSLSSVSSFSVSREWSRD